MSKAFELGYIAFLLLVIVGVPLALLVAHCKSEAARKKLLADGEARAYPVKGKVARFGTATADEYSVEYTFQLEGDSRVYSVDSSNLSKNSPGEMTSVGDMVIFRVLPGLRSVRDFYNANTARV